MCPRNQKLTQKEEALAHKLIAIQAVSWLCFQDKIREAQKLLEQIDVDKIRLYCVHRMSRLLKRASEKGCELIDLEKIFAELDHGKYFYDWNHPNVEGCELIASVTSRALQSCLKNALGKGASNARPF